VQEFFLMTTSEPTAISPLRTMRALVFDRELHLATIDRPQPLEGEALVRVRACGISRQDLDLARGHRLLPERAAVLGHEFVGEVVEATTSSGASWVGRRVVAYLNAGCNRCLPCRDGKSWLCEITRERAIGLGQLDGGLAEWVVVPERSLVEVPERVDDEEAIFAHPMASALSAAAWIDEPAPQRVLVVGDGNLGLLTTLVLHAAGHTVSVLGRHPSRRELLWRSGISFSGVLREGEQSNELSGAKIAAESYGLVCDCSGHASGLELSVAAARPRGRIILMSHYEMDEGFDLRFLTEKEIDLVGVSGGRLEDSLKYLQRKRIDILPLVEGAYSLSEVMAAFEKASRRGALKIMIRNPSTGGAA
jgi:threonine dehydrogenase-like Zn-dependent dehydrogenase